uniref:Syntaxin-16 n=1 Tax=Callithrix jacchus TaxID=9483 RepID=A0A5F4VWJ3_CALJA
MEEEERKDGGKRRREEGKEGKKEKKLADDRMALVSGISLDPEATIGVTKRSPPKWVDGVDEIQYDVGRIKQKMKELSSLHDKHLNRPTLDDSSEEEHAIEITTQEITQLFHRCQRAVQALPSRARACSEQEGRLLGNVVASLAQALQELSISFRHAQSGYLKRMKNREERSQHFFDTSVPLMDDGDDNTLYHRGFTDDQLVLVEQNTLMVEEREREIRQIVQSISDLNEIFRDLGAMIVEQVRELAFLVNRLSCHTYLSFFFLYSFQGKKLEPFPPTYVCARRCAPVLLCLRIYIHIYICLQIYT